MGLDLIGYKVTESSDWCASYSTFDQIRWQHAHAVEYESGKDKHLEEKLEKALEDNKCWLTLEETKNAFYNHSDCEGIWDTEEVAAIRIYLKSTRDLFKEYSLDDGYMQQYDCLIEFLEKSDVVEFC